MRKQLAKWGKAIATRSLPAIALNFLVSAALCHARSEAHSCLPANSLPMSSSTQGEYSISFDPVIWAPGHTYTVSIKGAFPIRMGPAESGSQDVHLSAFEWPIYPAPLTAASAESYVILSKLTYVSPKLSTFKAVVSANAPTGAVQLSLSADPGFQQFTGIHIQPPAPRTSPSPQSSFTCPMVTIASLSPSAWMAGIENPTVIKGSGFTSEATASCIATQIVITSDAASPTGRIFRLSKVRIVDSTTILAVITPGIGD
ncbi:MAG: hypothetical protein ABR898_16050 [Terracidiphilus sp.]|jgi:hypothetical protein